jgi:serine/threonine protein kinase
MLQPGQQVGAYRVIAQIGSGGMATVYKASHEKLERLVAIKVMHTAFMQDPNFRTRFEREAKIIARLDHPHIVPVYDYAEIDGQPYLVMKHIEGRTLKQTLIKQTLTLADILRLVSPIADALDYAHSMNVLHRDIKPSNIIIDPNGTPYLTDFGMARIAQVGESTISADMMLGTPQYISPEQALGKQDIDARTDLYSLGVVLYELIVGQVPFSGDTPYSVIHDHIYRALPLPHEVNPAVPPEVEAVLVKALAKEPSGRYTTAKSMMAALREALDASGVRELPPDRRERAAESLAKLRGETIPTIAPISAPQPPKVETPPATPKRLPTVELKLDLGSEDLGAEFRRVGQDLRKAGIEVKQALEEAGQEIGQTFRQNRPGGEMGDFQRQWGNDWRRSWDESRSGDENSENDDDNVPPSEEEYFRRRIAKRVEERNNFLGHFAVYLGVNAVLWGIFASSGGFEGFMSASGEFPWPMMTSAFWGAGVAAHAVGTYFATGARAARRDRAVRDTLRSRYGSNWFSVVTKKQLKEVRKQVTEKSRALEDFLSHLAVFLGVNSGLWAIWLGSGGTADSDFPWPAFVTLFWGIGLFFNALSATGSAVGQRMTERTIERELQRELGDESKPKCKNDLRLTEDGELSDSMVEALEAEDKPKRQVR